MNAWHTVKGQDAMEAIIRIEKQLKRIADELEHQDTSSLSYTPISAKEAADILGVSTVTVQKVAEEKLGGQKLSNGWVLDLQKVLEYKRASDVIKGG